MGRVEALVLGLPCTGLSGCAGAAPGSATAPYEPTNRDVLKLNGKIDKYFVVPTVAVYFVLVPEGGRRGVHNFLGNLSLPKIAFKQHMVGRARIFHSAGLERSDLSDHSRYPA
jgi:ABC-type transporter lipoprotein component MlaA